MPRMLRLRGFFTHVDRFGSYHFRCLDTETQLKIDRFLRYSSAYMSGAFKVRLRKDWPRFVEPSKCYTVRAAVRRRGTSVYLLLDSLEEAP